MANALKTEIFYADGDLPSTRAILPALSRKGMQVRSFHSVANCLYALESQDCHVLVNNTGNPAKEGIDLLVRARRAAPWLPVILLVDCGDIDTTVRAMKAGATDCMERPPEIADLLGTIERAAASGRKAAAMNGCLSPVERKVLRLILDGWTNPAIAEELSRSTRTVEVHRYHIMGKLGVRCPVDLVKVCMKMGLFECVGASEIGQSSVWVGA